MSCKRISIEEFDKITPVNPPSLNKKINPKFHSITTLHFITDPYTVDNQEKTLIPVGIAIIIVAAVK